MKSVKNFFGKKEDMLLTPTVTEDPSLLLLLSNIVLSQ